MSDTPVPTIGRIVHFQFENKHKKLVTRPGIIVNVISPTVVNIQIFVDGLNDNFISGSDHGWRHDIPYGPDFKANTWHWPHDPIPLPASAGKVPLSCLK